MRNVIRIMLFLPKLQTLQMYRMSLISHKPVKAKVPPKTAQSRVMKWRKLRRSSLIVTVIGERSYKKYTATYKTNWVGNWTEEHN